MRILLTGATGFLGTIISENLDDHVITRVGRTKICDIVCDLSEEIPLLSASDLVIHAAGKAHTVPNSIEENKLFYDVNVNGTKNLLLALERGSLPAGFVFISSVSVYGIEEGEKVTEDHPLTATDAYGRSKILAENLILDWCNAHHVKCTILRLPLVVGQNSKGNLEAMIKGINKGYYFNIGGGKAKKSMILATDVALAIADVHNIGGIYNITDGYDPSFEELSLLISRQLGRNKPLNLPLWLAATIAKIGDRVGNRFPLNSKKLKKITSTLTFDDSRVRRVLKWKSSLVLESLNIL